MQQALKDVVLLKADVTDNNDAHQTLMRNYGIIGPPATLFFDASGQEHRNFRLVGYIRPEPFAEHVERFHQ